MHERTPVLLQLQSSMGMELSCRRQGRYVSRLPYSWQLNSGAASRRRAWRPGDKERIAVAKVKKADRTAYGVRYKAW